MRAIRTPMRAELPDTGDQPETKRLGPDQAPSPASPAAHPRRRDRTVDFGRPICGRAFGRARPLIVGSPSRRLCTYVSAIDVRDGTVAQLKVARAIVELGRSRSPRQSMRTVARAGPAGPVSPGLCRWRWSLRSPLSVIPARRTLAVPRPSSLAWAAGCWAWPW